MELINESLAMKANKNFFNKLKSELLKESKNRGDIKTRIYFPNTDLRDRFLMSYRYNLDDIKFIEEGNKIYILSVIKFELVSIEYLNFQEGTEDCVFDCIRERLHYYKEWALENGFPKGNNTTDDEIRSSKLYKDIKRSVDEFKSSEMKITLNEKVYPRLKIRENVIPLAVYDTKDGILDYPWKELKSKNLMSSSPRDKKNTEQVIKDMKYVVRDCIRYTPFRRWLVLKSKCSDVIILE